LNESMRALPRPFRGQRRVAGFTRQQDVTREVEYLEETLEEAEAAARWYGERSATAGVDAVFIGKNSADSRR
jgi:hypothetical protein